MTEPLYFENLQVGGRWSSRARTVTEADVVHFAGLTGDYDPLHVDREFARQTPFGQPIAHGLLGLSFLAGLGTHHPLVHTVAFVAVRNWEFLLPIFIGDTVHAVNEVIELRENGRRRGTVLWKRQLVNQKGQVVQHGVFETLVAKMGRSTDKGAAMAADADRHPVPTKKARRIRKDAAAATPAPRRHQPKKRAKRKTAQKSVRESATPSERNAQPAGSAVDFTPV